MARIRTYESNETLRPTDSGANAWEQAGRRIGPAYNEAATFTRAAGAYGAQSDKLMAALMDQYKLLGALATGAEGTSTGSGGGGSSGSRSSGGGGVSAAGGIRTSAGGNDLFDQLNIADNARARAENAMAYDPVGAGAVALSQIAAASVGNKGGKVYDITKGETGGGGKLVNASGGSPDVPGQFVGPDPYFLNPQYPGRMDSKSYWTQGGASGQDTLTPAQIRQQVAQGDVMAAARGVNTTPGYYSRGANTKPGSLPSSLQNFPESYGPPAEYAGPTNNSAVNAYSGSFISNAVAAFVGWLGSAPNQGE